MIDLKSVGPGWEQPVWEASGSGASQGTAWALECRAGVAKPGDRRAGPFSGVWPWVVLWPPGWAVCFCCGVGRELGRRLGAARPHLEADRGGESAVLRAGPRAACPKNCELQVSA